MFILTALLSLLFFLKLLAIGNAVCWVISRGREYRLQCDATRPVSYESFFEIFETLNANFLPFGFKDYRLRRFVAKRASRRDRFVARVFQNAFFRYNSLTAIASLYVIFAVVAKLSCWSALGQPSWMLVLLSILMLLGNVALSVEAVVSYTVLGNYAVLFHMLTPTHSEWHEADLRLREVSMFASKFFVSIAAGSIAVFASHSLYQSFTKLPAFVPNDFLGSLGLLYDCLYFTLTTFLTIGYGDICPFNRLGQLVAMLIMLQGFMLIVGVFASLQSARF